ncbi:hypothetical protein Pla22_14110 [Rubripirellula amarantea]|uniref:DUF883 domain-containing protein n=1 Tax=Rubripirellula amarantea TaxID=2527999 RepID=A0A5C5WTB0_9BACT|nr:hypothetical protein [Rubripirellula amarantea]TWT53778.1 hypothetical protein Pla22_14110 [Rubripirellula amarantea]
MNAQTKTPPTESQNRDMHSKFDEATRSAGESLQEYGNHYVASPAKDVFGLLRDYAKDRPDVAAVWCFGLGVIVGWKLRR